MPLYILNFFPFLTRVFPGLSSVPPNMLPTITEDAPAANAFVVSPDVLMPPSEITGISYSLDTLTLSVTAVNCGTPDPVSTLVLQNEPQPSPRRTPPAQALIQALEPLRGA